MEFAPGFAGRVAGRVSRSAEREERFREMMMPHLALLEHMLLGGEVDETAVKRVRTIANLLESSAQDAGFQALSGRCALVGDATPGSLRARLSGLLDVLREVVDGGTGVGTCGHGWLLYAGAPYPTGSDSALEELRREPDVSVAWRAAAGLLGLTEIELAYRISSRLGIRVARLSRPSLLAARLLPVSLIEAGPILPVDDDGIEFVAASSNPTSLALIERLERITRRRARLEVAPPGPLQSAVQQVLERFPAAPGDLAEAQATSSKSGGHGTAR